MGLLIDWRLGCRWGWSCELLVEIITYVVLKMYSTLQ